MPVVGGVEKNLYEIALYLTLNGNHAYIISNSIDENTSDATGSWYSPSPELPPLCEAFEATIMRRRLPTVLRGLSFVRRRIDYPLAYSLYMAKMIAESAKSYNMDVLYAVEPALSSLVLASSIDRGLMRKRKVGGIRSSFYPANALEHAFARRVVRRLDAVIVSIFNTHTYHYLDNLTEGKAVFLPGWVDTSRFRPRNRSSARKLLGLENKNRLMLSIGRLVPEKGFEDLLETFGWVRKALSKDVSLLIVGSGPLKSSLKRLIDAHELNGSVELWNAFQFSDRVYPLLYNAADLFVFMPRHDGVSQVALEAMASGLPVAYSNVGGIPRLLRSSFHIINSQDPRTTCETLTSVVENSSKNERTTNTRIIQKHFSKEKQLPKFVEVLLGTSINYHNANDSLVEE